LYTLGLLYRFGKEAPPPIARAARDVIIEPEPAPARAPPPPPPPPPTRKKVSFSGDALFDFAKETLRPAGMLELDKFAAELRGTRFDVITVTGHTDRIGSAGYNLKLSQRRAETVKSYLVDKAGIPADKVTTTGADGSDPVTKPEDCKGRTRTPALIACLQPDRRVDVEVTGTQPQPASPTN
jgi:OOP family OmpA-OmpF porin